MEGSHTANLRAGMPAHTMNRAIRWMLGNAGSWSIPAGATAGARPSAPHVLRSPLSPMWAGTASSTLSHPWDNAGKAPRVWPGAGPLSLLQESAWAAQGALAWEQGWRQPRGSPQSAPSKSISAHPAPPPCPVLWPQLSSCLVPALSCSFILRVRKETAHCQISYLRGNLSRFIELPVMGPGLLRAVPVTSMRR